MHDLRKKALLESKKTSSRKARSKDVTPLTTRKNTPAASRATSRVRGGSSRGGSDDELDGELSDETSFSVGSIDGIIVNGDASEQNGESQVCDRIEEIFARKGSTSHGREKCYKAYVHLLAHDYLAADIQAKEDELVAAFLRSVKEETSEKETVLALKGIAMTLVTSPSDIIFESVFTPLKRTITHSESIPVKAAAIHTLGTCTYYGGASDDAILEVLDFLLEIIASDGHTISAPDESPPVVAALEEWGFLCTLADDLSEQSEEAVETFAEQTGSSYASVQIAAGENIALLYEKSFRALDHDEDDMPSISAEDILSDPDETPGAPKLLRLYPAYRRTDQLLHNLTSLSRNNHLSVHSISKADRKALKTNFSDIASSIEFPHRGPKYSTAFDEETGCRYGSRMKVKIHKEGVMRIDKWWKLHRLRGLRRVLQGGFVTHYEKNEVVFETLPIMIEREKNHGS